MGDERFSFEDLEVWQEAVDFADLCIARGSLFETVTLLEIFRRRSWIRESEFSSIKRAAIQLGKRISALINSIKKP